MIKKSIATFLLTISVVFFAHAQVITTDPPFPTADGAVTITLNATGTGLEGYSGDVYAHTGLTIDGNKWQNVIGSWGNNTNQPKLNRIGANEYTLVITPSIRQFYGASSSANITEICMVFRSADNSQQTSPDIFQPVYVNELNVVITFP